MRSEEGRQENLENSEDSEDSENFEDSDSFVGTDDMEKEQEQSEWLWANGGGEVNNFLLTIKTHKHEKAER